MSTTRTLTSRILNENDDYITVTYYATQTKFTPPETHPDDNCLFYDYDYSIDIIVGVGGSGYTMRELEQRLRDYLNEDSSRFETD